MTIPPEQPAGGTTRPSMGGMMPGQWMASGARMPLPGNAEFALYIAVEIVLVLIWIIAKSVNTELWSIFTVVLTSFYFLSRGIAKASRVLEQ
jgi:hypothetical protein